MLVPGSANSLLLRTVAAPAAGGISRSLRFNSSDSGYCSFTPSSAGNSNKFTFAGWLKLSKIPAALTSIIGGGASGIEFVIGFNSSAQFFMQEISSGGSTTHYNVTTTAVFRDPSSWYHLAVVLDTTEATGSNRVKLWINGLAVQLNFNTTPSLNYSTLFADATYKRGIGAISANHTNYAYLDGYLADIYFIDGQALTPSSFTETDATTGQLIPKAYTGSYGTNGFHLEFADNSSNTATTLGKDTSGNGNNWTPNNLSVTAGAGNDSLVDVPTNGAQTDTGVGGEVRGNYATLNPLDVSSLTTSNGNLQLAASAAGYVRGTMNLAGKTYWETTITTAGLGGIIGVMQPNGAFPYTNSNGYHSGGTQYVNGSSVGSWGASWTTGDIIGIAVDTDAGTITAYKNGSSQGSKTISTTVAWMPWIHSYDGTYNVNFGQRPFAYTAPSGFKALNTASLPAPVITKPSTVFDVKLYTGNGSTQTISNLLFSPDFVWIKSRNNASWWHALFDTVRGAGNFLHTNNTNVEGGGGTSLLSSFTSEGFSLNNSPNGTVNGTSDTYVAWAWDAGSSTDTNNTAGTITPTGVRANATAGFSVVTYTGNGSAGATIGHGLGVAPQLVITKSRSAANSWAVYHQALGNTKFLFFETTDAAQTNSTAWNNTSPTSTVVTFGTGTLMNGSGTTYVAYCFAPVVGYSSFGSYVGNGSSDGVFVYTGFRPRWVMVKQSSASGEGWWIRDAARNTYNSVESMLAANSSGAEISSSGYAIDFLSNGFKLRNSNPDANASGATYVYAAFAESPFNYARAR